MSYLDDEEFKETIDLAYDELKRLDHLIFVSLKYTRTADMLKQVMKRMISFYELAIKALLEFAKEEKKISEIPDNPVKMCDALKEVYPEIPDLQKNIDTYLKFRKMDKLEYESVNEYRRHVAMILDVEGEKVEINIDTVTDLYKQIKQFFHEIRMIVRKEEE